MAKSSIRPFMITLWFRRFMFLPLLGDYCSSTSAGVPGPLSGPAGAHHIVKWRHIAKSCMGVTYREVLTRGPKPMSMGDLVGSMVWLVTSNRGQTVGYLPDSKYTPAGSHFSSSRNFHDSQVFTKYEEYFLGEEGRQHLITSDMEYASKMTHESDILLVLQVSTEPSANRSMLGRRLLPQWLPKFSILEAPKKLHFKLFEEDEDEVLRGIPCRSLWSGGQLSVCCGDTLLTCHPAEEVPLLGTLIEVRYLHQQTRSVDQFPRRDAAEGNILLRRKAFLLGGAAETQKTSPCCNTSLFKTSKAGRLGELGPPLYLT
ncbi:hypothetical protein CCACVL1_19689 [Corchorus capsularis]|uniref:Uncharacterized protein n=1 Tax=Corchorus capsularis TaxID=210143 RepID=A0A1R3HFF2_COCAP|nr:hypothetical protein CCACVL1_19689 [Corchorus capsularis]